MNITFGKILRKLMQEKNLSGRALAIALDVPHKTVQDWLAYGSRMPRDPEVIRRLADYFNVTTHFLLFGEEDPRSLFGEIFEKTEIHTGLYEITIKRVRSRIKEDKK